MQVATHCQLTKAKGKLLRLCAIIGYQEFQTNIEEICRNQCGAFYFDLRNEGFLHIIIKNSYIASLPCNDESIAKVKHSKEGTAYINCKINRVHNLYFFKV